MGLGAGLVDFIGGAADSAKKTLDQQLQEEADTKKAQLLSKLQAQRDEAKAKQRSEDARRKEDHAILRQSIEMEDANERSKREIEARAQAAKVAAGANKYRADRSYAATTEAAATRAAAAIKQAEEKRKDKTKGNGLLDWFAPKPATPFD